MLNATETTQEGKTLSEIAAMANDPKFAQASESSTEAEETDAKEPGSMQEAVQQALAGRSEAETVVEDSSTKTNASEEKETTEEVEAGQEVEKEEPDEKVKPQETDEEKTAREAKEQKEQERLDKNPRFQEVLKERNEFKPLAESARVDQQYCQQWGISTEQKKSAMELLALINSKPSEALVHLEKLVDDIKLNTGAKLPDDLAKRVADNLISQEDAMELHKARLQNKRLEQQQQSFAQQTAQEQVVMVTQALGQWGVAKMKVDADFKPKAEGAKDGKFELVHDRLSVLTSRTNKKSFTPAEATALAEEAYVYVNDLFKQFNPQRRGGRVVFPSRNGSSHSGSEGEEPTSMRDAVAKAIGRKHGIRLRPDVI
jgi:hypothetical protein